MRVLLVLVVLALIGAGAAWWLSEPRALSAQLAAEVEKPGDAKAGEVVFWTAGCSGCHANNPAKEPLKLGGGDALNTPFGKIYSPNISMDADDGIGKWSAEEFARALYDGVDDEGAFIYPAMPYASYHHVSVEDTRNLWAFMRTLPAVKGSTPPPAFGFPFNIRRLVGLWQWLYLPKTAPPPSVAVSDSADYGRYLVQGAGHCGECHTPRNFLGAMETDKALTGAKVPDFKGKAPDITAAGLKKWSEADIETALTLGITPDGDSLGGPMAEVVRNLSHLPKGHITAIARYLKAQ